MTDNTRAHSEDVCMNRRVALRVDHAQMHRISIRIGYMRTRI